MRDAETRAALDRISNKNLWIVGWIWCVISTLTVGTRILEDWGRWTVFNRNMSGCLVT